VVRYDPPVPLDPPRAPDVDFGHDRACEVCGGRLTAEVYWITSYPAGVHERCRDWSTVAFPYARDLASLRRLVGRARRAAKTVIAVGTRLAAIEREWPRGGAAAVAESRQLIERAREEIIALGLEWPRS
jgi:hypothetical protein